MRRKVGLGAVATAVLALSLTELMHHRRFGHFVGYGLYTDVSVGNSDIGSHDMYYARLLNATLMPFDLEGCVFANDVLGQPDSIVHRWDVQKRDFQSEQWLSLHGADTWVASPFGGY